MKISKNNIVIVFLLLSLVGQIVLSFCFNMKAQKQTNLTPPLEIKYYKLLSFGDFSFSYYINALKLQNIGDNSYKKTSLNEYNYKYILKWLELLESIDDKSNYAPFLAAFYFGNTKNKKDIRLMIDFLKKHYKKDINKKWRWLAHSLYLAKYKLKDYELALDIAKELSNIKLEKAPYWTRQAPAFVLKKMGKEQQVKTFFVSLIATDKNIPENEKKFMLDYIKKK